VLTGFWKSFQRVFLFISIVLFPCNFLSTSTTIEHNKAEIHNKQWLNPYHKDLPTSLRAIRLRSRFKASAAFKTVASFWYLRIFKGSLEDNLASHLWTCCCRRFQKYSYYNAYMVSSSGLNIKFFSATHRDFYILHCRAICTKGSWGIFFLIGGSVWVFPVFAFFLDQDDHNFAFCGWGIIG